MEKPTKKDLLELSVSQRAKVLEQARVFLREQVAEQRFLVLFFQSHDQDKALLS